MFDKEFLKKLDLTSSKEIYAEIIALNKDEEVIETIEGRVSAGTINVDGASAVRRTCTLTIVAEELNIHEYYWGLHTKFKLSLGIKNEIDDNYPEIIWFKQGTFVISNFTTTQNTSSYTISIQGKDKMTLLNGEMGGMITSLTHDFGKVSVVKVNGDTTEEDLLLKDIIIGAVHQFANEPLYNIIVNDLEDQGLELLEYRGDSPFYLLIDETSGETFNISFNGKVRYIEVDSGKEIALEDIPEEKYNPLFDLEQTDVVMNYMKIKDDSGNILSVAKMSYGKTAGYRLTPLTYAGDLILNVGDNVCSMLDKIVNMLGQYEYFYDVDGRFIFQRKKTYFNTSWNNIITNSEETYVEPSAYTSAISYSFEDGQLVSSYQNNPNFANIKNDFSVWGTRKSVTGQELPVHMRYAIDIKPEIFVNYENKLFSIFSYEEIKNKIKEWYNDESPQLEIYSSLDWRELIYQMALDYQKHHLEEDYYLKLAESNFGNYMNGKTGYEQYYVDMEGFWRQLYNPEYESSYEQVYLSGKMYEGKENEYYYAKDKYKLCTKDMPYRSSAGYFTWTADENYKYSMTPIIGLSKASYEDTVEEGKYYIIDADEPYDIVDTMIIEPYHKDGLGYYNKDGIGTVLGAISEKAYFTDPSQYYQFKEKEYLPCAKVENYKASRTYYLDDKSMCKPQPTEEEYYANAGNYYYREYSYTQCSENDKYDGSITYYMKTVSAVVDDVVYASIKAINEEIFNKNKSQYYIRSEEAQFVRCVVLLRDNYISGKYFTLSSGEYIESAINKNGYLSEAFKGNLYYEQLYLECCKHYLAYDPSIKFYKKIEDEYDKDTHWVKEVSLNPEGLNFWFDFLDEDSELQKFGSYAIGNRPKGVNDNQIKSIYFRETPTVIFVDADEWDTADRSKLGYTYLKLPANLVSLFSISAQGKSAKTVVDEYIYKYACTAESITISVLPIYHLEPNTRIFVRNDESGINGEYILTRYSLNLGTNNTMSISASKAVDRLY